MTVNFDPHITPSRWLTHSVPGTGGHIKASPDDFLVEEIPAYEPCGDGEHIYMLIEKRNMSTMDLVRRLARHFGVRRDAVGTAGLKDRFAVTRQLVSVHTPGKKPADFPSFEADGVVVHWVDRHTNKLRRGHLAGNRFVIRIRGVEPGKVVHAHRTLSMLERLGVPNRVGEQRFGTIARNHVIGLGLLKKDAELAVRALLGMPPGEGGGDGGAEGAWVPSNQRAMREAFDRGEYGAALAAAPRSLLAERRALGVLSRGGGMPGAMRAVDRAEQSFFVAAFQSAVFNRVLDERLSAGTLGALEPGDVASKHDSGAVFAVSEAMLSEDADGGPGSGAAELRRRLDALEISPSGPMWGLSMMLAQGAVGERERRVLDDLGVTMEMFERVQRTGIHLSGARRALRVRLSYPDIEAGQDEHGGYIKLRFELPAGSFATSVVQEIIKPAPGQPLSKRADTGAAAPSDQDASGEPAHSGADAGSEAEEGE